MKNISINIAYYKFSNSSKIMSLRLYKKFLSLGFSINYYKQLDLLIRNPSTDYSIICLPSYSGDFFFNIKTIIIKILKKYQTSKKIFFIVLGNRLFSTFCHIVDKIIDLANILQIQINNYIFYKLDNKTFIFDKVLKNILKNII